MKEFENYKVVLLYRFGVYSLEYLCSEKWGTILVINENRSGGYRSANLIKKTFNNMEEAKASCSEYLI